MKKLAALFLFVSAALCSTCSLQRQLSETITTSPDNVFTLSIMSTMTSNDVILWKKSPDENITIETVVYSEDRTELDAVLTNSSRKGNFYEYVFSSTYTTNTPSNPNSNDDTISSSFTLRYSPVFFTALALAFGFQKNIAIGFAVLFFAGLINLPTSFAPCTSSAVIRVYIPDTVMTVCYNKQCFSNSAIAGLGVAIGFTHPEDGEIDMLRQAFHSIRMDFGWEGTENPKGSYDFSEYDFLFNSTPNITNYYILDYSNPNYDNGLSPYTPEGRAGMAAWAKAAVQQFKGKKILWEMYNEPNGAFWLPSVNITAYSLMSNEVGKSIKETAESEVFFGPATAGMDFEFIEGCFKLNTLEYWDAVSVHPYRRTDPEAVESDYFTLRRLISKYKPENKLSVPIFSGEWGYSTAWYGMNYNDSIISTYIVREYLVNMANEIPVSIWYDWHDDGDDPNYDEFHFGTVFYPYNAGSDPVYQPKLQYTAALTLNLFLDQKKFNKRFIVSDSEGDYVLLFSNGSENPVIVVWTTSYTSVVLDIPCSTGSFGVTDYLNKKTKTLSCNSGGKKCCKLCEINFQVLKVTATREPVYVVPTSSNDFLNVVSTSSRLQLETLSLTDIVQLEVHIENPTSNTITVSLEGDSGSISLAPEDATKLARTVAFDRTQSSIPYSLTVVIQDLGSFTMATIIGPVFPVTISPVSLTKSEMVVAIDTSEQSLNGALNVSLFSQLQGKTDVTINSFSGINIVTIPLSNYAVPTGVPIPTTIFLDNSQTTVGKFDSNFTITDSFTSISSYAIVAEGDDTVASTVDLSVSTPAEGPPFPGLGVFKISYQFDAGWKYFRIYNDNSGPFINLTIVNTVSFWLYGDNSYNTLGIRILDANMQTFQPAGPYINWSGWKLVTIEVFTSNTDFWGGDGVPVYPLSWDTLLLLDGNMQQTSGEIYMTAPIVY